MCMRTLSSYHTFQPIPALKVTPARGLFCYTAPEQQEIGRWLSAERLVNRAAPTNHPFDYRRPMGPFGHASLLRGEPRFHAMTTFEDCKVWRYYIGSRHDLVVRHVLLAGKIFLGTDTNTQRSVLGATRLLFCDLKPIPFPR